MKVNQPWLRWVYERMIDLLYIDVKQLYRLYLTCISCQFIQLTWWVEKGQKRGRDEETNLGRLRERGKER